jgi:hypothetical protein
MSISYVTDLDRIGNRFFDSISDATDYAEAIAKQFPGNRVYVLREHCDFYFPRDPKGDALKEAERVLEKVWKEHVMPMSDTAEVKRVLDAVKAAQKL